VTSLPPASSLLFSLSLHDALPILQSRSLGRPDFGTHGREFTARPASSQRRSWRSPDGGETGPHPRGKGVGRAHGTPWRRRRARRSEEHTSELQSRENHV